MNGICLPFLAMAVMGEVVRTAASSSAVSTLIVTVFGRLAKSRPGLDAGERTGESSEEGE